VQKKVEKVTATLRLLPELARKLDDVTAVVLQRATTQQAVAVFAVRRGFLSAPFLLEFDSIAADPRSVEAILRERLESEAAEELPGGSATLERRADHLSLLARWYYSKPRAGEILYFDTARGGWPYRRIVRACSRLLAGAGAAS